jgi:hypothetical protein
MGEEADMSIQLVIELTDRHGAQTIMQALDAYKVRLRASIDRTKRHLATFETRYGVDTAHFLSDMTAEDLAGGDLEYVEWAGEARLLEGLEAELWELEDARYHLP